MTKLQSSPSSLGAIRQPHVQASATDLTTDDSVCTFLGLLTTLSLRMAGPPQTHRSEYPKYFDYCHSQIRKLSHKGKKPPHSHTVVKKQNRKAKD